MRFNIRKHAGATYGMRIITLIVISVCGASLVGCAPMPDEGHLSQPVTKDAAVADLVSRYVSISGYAQQRFYMMPASRLFYNQSAQLYQTSLPLLDHLIEIIIASPHHEVEVSVVIADHHEHSNKHGLLLQQAQAVASYLWAHGVDARYMVSTAGTVKRNDKLAFWRNHADENTFVQIRAG